MTLDADNVFFFQLWVTVIADVIVSQILIVLTIFKKQLRVLQI